MRCAIRPAVFVLVLFSIANHVAGESFEIFPASRRENKTVYCIGNELGKVWFSLWSKDVCHHKLPDFKEPLQPLYLNVYWPSDVEVLGFGTNWLKPHASLRDFPFEKTVKDGREYNLFRIDFVEDSLKRIVLRSGNYMDIHLWFRAPEELNKELFWELNYGDKTLAREKAVLKTVGTIAPGTTFSEDFMVFLHHTGSDCGRLDGKDMDDRIDFYKNAGFTHMGTFYFTYDRPKYYVIVSKLRQAGIKTIAERHNPISFHEHNATFIEEQKPGGKGLFFAANEFRKAIDSPRELGRFRKAAEWADGFVYDYETPGPQQVPGRDDKATIGEFAKSIGVEDEMTEDLLRSTYSRQYYDFRMRLCSYPVFGLRDMIDRASPDLPLFLAHGSGLPIYELDYKAYDKAVQYHMPMIYTGDGMEFFNKVDDFVGYVPKEKIVPITTAGWIFGPMTKATPADYIMNVVAAAVTGCRGISTWPGLEQNDATVSYGLYRGAALVAPFVRFFQKGRPAEEIELTALPFHEKRVKVGDTTIDLSTPQWANFTVLRVCELGGEYALAMLNYSKSTDMFVSVSAGNLKKNYCLVNPAARSYIEAHGEQELSPETLAAGVCVKVPANSAGLWLLTPEIGEAGDYAAVRSETVWETFRRRRDESGKGPGASRTDLGRKGKIETGYRNLRVADAELPCLFVKTDNQEFSFTMSGGRILEWKSENSDNFVKHKNIRSDGFCMDLLWVPASGRWSGDEIADMRIERCENNGRDLTLTFAGVMHSALSGIRIEKTYRIRARRPGIDVSIRLLNENPAPYSLISYWNHNVMNASGEDCEFIIIGEDGKRVDAAAKIAAYANIDGKTADTKWIPESMLKGRSSSVFGVYVPARRLGLVFELPEDFLMVHRWSDRHQNNPEWMERPLQVPCGGEMEVDFSIAPFVNTGIGDFTRSVNRQNRQNLFVHGFSGLAAGEVPARYLTLIEGEDSVAADDEVFFGDRGPSVRMESKTFGELNLDSPFLEFMEAGKSYLLTLKVKVNDMRLKGHWWTERCGFWVRVYDTKSDKQTWCNLGGNGSTDGWVTVMLPFKHDELAHGTYRLLFRCKDMTGMVWIQDPVVIEIPEGVDMERSFVLSDGRTVVGSHLTLK